MMPRVVIAAPHGRSGKTTVTLALCAAFVARGLAVQPFKKGPDYIDPSWLTAAAQRPARNLDAFMLSADAIRRTLARAADLAIIEGNHGLFDSLDEDGRGSTAALARLVRAPILLVVDAARMGRSVGALVAGYQHFESDTNVAGVILNNVAQPRHAAKLRNAIEQHCAIPVLGILPRDDALTIADRHLGLIPRGEYAAQVREPLAALCRAAQEHLELDAILEIARSASPLTPHPPPPSPGVEVHSRRGGRGRRGWGVRIGVMHDAAFTFYYPENLEALQDAGAELVFIDALRDSALPAVDALYVGGGFPEVFAEQLEANVSLRADIRGAIENDLPVYAECGGLMYLARSLRWRERRWEMVGALPCDVEIMDKPQGHGYVQATVCAPNPFFAEGLVLRGHEYHHSRVVKLDLPLAYRLSRGHGINGGDGIVYRNVLAAYTHLHALGAPQWATAFAPATQKS
ncbi:MAG: cobyrinate a,c-diamide synthase [Chloroflexi bacterium]|nr:cobyrinate a,c-diamide synthase [Chloroflexota bacterium]